MDRAITLAAASMHMSGLTVTEVERVAAGDLATGRIRFAEYSRRVDIAAGVNLTRPTSAEVHVPDVARAGGAITRWCLTRLNYEPARGL